MRHSYHVDINLQMNHWGVDQTGLGNLQIALWNYLENTWVPRGTETAKLLYDAPGWVAHDEVNSKSASFYEEQIGFANYGAEHV